MFDTGLLVQEVDFQSLEAGDLDAGSEVRQFIQLLLGSTPVKGIFPVSSQALQISEGSAVVPSGVVEFIGKASEREASFEVGEVSVWDRDGEGLDVCHYEDVLCYRLR